MIATAVASGVMLSLVVGCGPAGAPTSGSGVLESNEAVLGTVIDADGEPAAGVRVRIGTAITTTNVDGTFSIPDVPAKYVVAAALSDGSRAYVFDGLESRSPILRVFDVAMSLRTHGTSVLAKLAEPLRDSERIVFLADGGDTKISTVVRSDTQEGPLVAIRWLGNPQVDTRVVLLKYEVHPDSSLPPTWTGIARARFPLAHRMDATFNVSFEPVAEQLFDVQARSDASPASWATVSVRLGPHAPITSLFDWTAPPLRQSWRVPVLDGALFRIETFAESSTGTAIARTAEFDGPGDVTTLSVPASPSPRLWRGRGDAVRVGWSRGPTETYFACFASGNEAHDVRRVFVATSASSVELPDLTDLGVPPLEDPVFYAVGAPGAHSVEDAAERGLLEPGDGPDGSTLPIPIR